MRVLFSFDELENLIHLRRLNKGKKAVLTEEILELHDNMLDATVKREVDGVLDDANKLLCGWGVKDIAPEESDFTIAWYIDAGHPRDTTLLYATGYTGTRAFLITAPDAFLKKWRLIPAPGDLVTSDDIAGRCKWDRFLDSGNITHDCYGTVLQVMDEEPEIRFWYSPPGEREWVQITAPRAHGGGMKDEAWREWYTTHDSRKEWEERTHPEDSPEGHKVWEEYKRNTPDWYTHTTRRDWEDRKKR